MNLQDRTQLPDPHDQHTPVGPLIHSASTTGLVWMKFTIEVQYWYWATIYSIAPENHKNINQQSTDQQKTTMREHPTAGNNPYVQIIIDFTHLV